MQPSYRNKKDASDFIGLVVFISILGIFIFIVGVILGWFMPAPGKISMEIDWGIENSDFYKYEERDGKPYITIQDKEYSALDDDSHLKEMRDEIIFTASNYKQTSSDLEWEMEIKNSANSVNTYKRNTIPAGMEYHLFESDFNLGYGENKIKVTAKNKKGSESFELVVVKLRVSDECAKSENAEVEICKLVKNAKESDAKQRAEQEKKDEELRKSWQKNSSGSSSVKKNSCVHYEYGKCWDELEDRAYEDGARDGANGNGHSYYDPNCTGVCEDIYEDAYEEGYYDGKHGL